MKKTLICIFYFNTLLPNNIITISIPKCGTHLLNKCIDLLTKKSESSIITQDPHPTLLPKSSINAIKKKPFYLSKHLLYTPENVLLLKKNKFKAIFIMRDPRDKIISWINFVYKYNGPKIWWPSINNNNLHDNIFILMNDCSIYHSKSGPWSKPLSLGNIKGIDDFYNHFLGWMNESDLVYTTSFEKLVGPQGGGTKKEQIQEIKNIADHLNIHISDQEAESIGNKLFGSTHTFQKGKINNWKEFFTLEHKKKFKEIAGQLLIDLGYENDFNW